MRSLRSISFAITLLATVASESSAKTKIPEKETKVLLEKYAELAFEEYSQSVITAQALQKAIDELVTRPTAETHQNAKNAWAKARDAYSVTEAFRFYGGPIDDPKTGPESLINAWPIDEAYMDGVQGQPTAGIVHNEAQYPVLNKDILTSLNQKNGERNVSTGYHAIEFLLWGQDLSLESAGLRTSEDFDPAKSKAGGRRGVYLKVLAELLIEHLSQVRDAWDPKGSLNYGKLLAAEPREESLRKIYTGLTNLSIDEMSGERMTVALEKSDQENEQDCFSDYTVNDMRSNQLGIRKIYDAGLRDVIAAIDPKLAKSTDKALKDASDALSAIPSPFDQVIASKKGSKGRKAADKAIQKLQTQGETLGKSGKRIGLILNVQ